jgi:hypothetical protein
MRNGSAEPRIQFQLDAGIALSCSRGQARFAAPRVHSVRATYSAVAGRRTSGYGICAEPTPGVRSVLGRGLTATPAAHTDLPVLRLGQGNHATRSDRLRPAGTRSAAMAGASAELGEPRSAGLGAPGGVHRRDRRLRRDARRREGLPGDGNGGRIDRLVAPPRAPEPLRQRRRRSGFP